MIYIILFLLSILIVTKLTYSINMIDNNQYIVLKCVFPNKDDLGGFAWHLHHVQCLIELCRLENKKPIVYYNGGYYHNKSKGDNWWTHYFEPIDFSESNEDIIKFGESHGYTEIKRLPLENSNRPYLYTNHTFQSILRKTSIDFHKCYDYIKPNKHIQSIIDAFVNKNFNGKYVVGVHYRGTDKFMANGDHEDLKSNKHFKYEDIIKKIRDRVCTDCVLFIASDEQPFVDTCHKYFTNCVQYNTSRSDVNTSGLSFEKSIDCKNYNENSECKKLKDIQKQSIHRGENDIDPYKKGEDSVVDIWLLSKCNVFFRTHGGNFGSQPKRINPTLEVIDVV